jgi:hypothetical protein
MRQEWDLLQEINKTVCALRAEVASLRGDLERAGVILGERPNPKAKKLLWSPPMLMKLGDMLTILAQTNPAAAAREGADKTPAAAAKDPPTDPTVDGDNDVLNRNTDPDHGVDMNARDKWTFDNDPTKKDGKDKVADVPPDPHRTPRQDDDDNINQMAKDGAKDGIT